MTAPLPRSLSQLSRLTSLNVTQGEYDYAHQLFDNLDGPVVRCVLGNCMHRSDPCT